MTLVNTQCLYDLRSKRMWSKVYQGIPQTFMFDGVKQTIHSLHKKNIITGIVTSAPRSYANKVVKHHKIGIDVTIAFHDSVKHKPNPEPILDGCKKLGLNPLHDKIISIGDEIIDIIAANNIKGVIPIGVSWGLDQANELIDAGAKKVLSSFQEIEGIIEECI